MRIIFQTFFFSLLGLFCYQLAPFMQGQESFCIFISSEKFQEKLKKKCPAWMSEQMEADFQGIHAITQDAVRCSYGEIREKVGLQNIFHYRIIDNKLYKFVPARKEYTSRDSRLEKAIKTLLLQTKVPDLDFLLSPMDGVPEPYFSENSFHTTDQVPILAQAKIAKTPFIVLIPDQFSLSDDWAKLSLEILHLNEQIAWESKQENANWRGGLTDLGIPSNEMQNLKLEDFFSPRFLIAELSDSFPELIDAGIHWIYREGAEIASHPTIKKVVKGSLSHEQQLSHKYLPVLDGHMCTYPGYQWRLLSNSVVFKQESNQIQWFYLALKPFEHFIPIENRMEDLISRILWAKEHDREARRISENAQLFARENLMIEDDYFYLLQVFKRYASLQKIDFEKVKASMQRDPHWLCIQYRKRLQFQRKVEKAVNDRIAGFLSIAGGG